MDQSDANVSYRRMRFGYARGPSDRGTQVLPHGFDPELVLRLFEEERGTVMLCVPTMLIRMLEHPSIGDRDFSSWRLVTLGGAPVPPELVRRTQSMGIKVAIGFGQTEASPYVTHHTSRTRCRTIPIRNGS